MNWPSNVWTQFGLRLSSDWANPEKLHHCFSDLIPSCCLKRLPIVPVGKDEDSKTIKSAQGRHQVQAKQAEDPREGASRQLYTFFTSKYMSA
jgi:hypothetical protein